MRFQDITAPRPTEESLAAEHAQAGLAHRARADPGGADPRPIEEGQVRSRAANGVGVEEVIGGNVVLVDGLFHQAHAELTGVEIEVSLGVGGDRRDVVQAVENRLVCLHGKRMREAAGFG